MPELEFVHGFGLFHRHSESRSRSDVHSPARRNSATPRTAVAELARSLGSDGNGLQSICLERLADQSPKQGIGYEERYAGKSDGPAERWDQAKCCLREHAGVRCCASVAGRNFN